MISPKKSFCAILSAILIAGSALAVNASSTEPVGISAELVAVKGGGAYASYSSGVSAASEIDAETSLPTSYSSRELGYTTTVKNQGEKNNCWAYATTSVFEILLNKDGKYTEPFSTSHIDNWATPRADGSGWQRNFQTDGAIVKAPEGYLTSWQGPKYESDFPDDMTKLPQSYLETDEYPDYGVTSLIVLDDSSNETIKSAIMKYGAVWASYSNEDEYLSEDTLSYYSPVVDPEKGHAITVVGWDDNYSKTNFDGASGQPEGDGAWLIQNSWGTGIHDGGFFWISYYDASLFSDALNSYAIADYQEIDEYTHLYQDGIYGAATATYQFVDSIKEAQNINVFDFEKDNMLDKVIFYHENPGDSYEIYYIPIDETTETPTDNTDLWISLGEGTVDYVGYICADITDYELPEGEGAICVSISTTDSALKTVGMSKDITYSDGSPLFIAPDNNGSNSYFGYTLNSKKNIENINTSRLFADNEKAVFVIKAVTYDSKVLDDYENGDVNMDGTINIKDATAIQKHIVGMAKLSSRKLNFADFDNSGAINGNDVLMIEKKIVHLI